MNYWKTVEAGDYKIYGKKFFGYYLNNRNKFRTYSLPYWNELNPNCIDEMLNMMGGMREMLATSVKTVEGGLKQRGPAAPEDSAEDVLKLLEGGKGG